MKGEQFAAALSSLELSIDEFAEKSGTHRTSVYRWIREGDVPRWAEWVVMLLRERKRIRDMLRD